MRLAVRCCAIDGGDVDRDKCGYAASLRSLVPQPFCKRTGVVRRGLFAPTLTPHPPCDGLEVRLRPCAFFFAERKRNGSVLEELRDSFLTPDTKHSRWLPCCARVRAQHQVPDGMLHNGRVSVQRVQASANGCAAA